MAKQSFPNKGRNFGKRNFPGQGQYRKNQGIRAPKVRLIGADGEQVGVVPVSEALNMARQLGLDLVEVSATAKPPVCRILDFGKFMYEESKKNKGHKSTTVKLKEVKFRINIDDHDYLTKIKRAESFLNKGSKVKFTVSLRGREMQHSSRAFDVLNRSIEDLKEMSTVEVPPKMLGRNVSMTLAPLPANKRKLRFNIEEELEEEA